MKLDAAKELLKKIEELRRENPNIKADAMAQALGLTTTAFYWRVREAKRIVDGKPARGKAEDQEETETKGLEITYSLGGLIKKLDELSAYVKELAKAQKRKAEELFL